MTFPPEGTSMHASRFRSLRSKLFFAALLASPITSLAQSDSIAIRSNYVVSVQELRMAGKGHAYFERASRLLEAERSLDQALRRSENFAQAYLLLTRIHLRQLNLPAAVKDLESYLKLEPRNEQARGLAEQLHRQMERQSAAMVATAQP